MWIINYDDDDYDDAYSCTMQAKAPAERDVEALLCGFETTSNRSWPNESWIIHVNNPWLNYGWLWSHR